MKTFEFSVIVASGPKNHEQALDAADALGAVGCLDASVCGHAEGMELVFDREGKTLSQAMATAVADVESAGFIVKRVELPRECIPVGVDN